jgi:hypothetical protein
VIDSCFSWMFSSENSSIFNKNSLYVTIGIADRP